MTDKRLIDANALKEWLGCDGDNKYSSMIMHEVADRIDEQPTIDAVEVVHGQWVLGVPITCSVCRKPAAEHDSPISFWESPYCPWCGAKMDAKDIDVHTKDGGEPDGNPH